MEQPHDGATRDARSFITQTDRHGNAATPRKKQNELVPKYVSILSPSPEADDPCDTILDTFRMMCCGLPPEDKAAHPGTAVKPLGASRGQLR